MPEAIPCRLIRVEIRAPPNGGASSRLMFKPTFPGFPVVVGAGSPVGASWATVNERRVRRRRSKQPGDCAEALELVATRYKIRRDHESGTDAVRRLNDALQILERTGERFFAAGLSRHKGRLLLQQGHSETAEELYIAR
jgi:hypothetical protein